MDSIVEEVSSDLVKDPKTAAREEQLPLSPAKQSILPEEVVAVNVAAANVKVDNWQAGKTLAERGEYLLEHPEVLSDFTLTIKNGDSEVPIKGIKQKFAEASVYFYEQFFVNRKDKLTFPDTSVEAFKIAMRFIYTGSCEDLDEENVFDVVDLAKQFFMTSLLEVCEDFITENTGPELAAQNLEQADLFDLDLVRNHCLDVIRIASKEVFDSPDFTKIQQKTLLRILQDECLTCDEFAIFQAVKKWAEAKCLDQGKLTTRDEMRTILGECLYLIRFPCLAHNEIAEGVKDLLTSDEMVDLWMLRIEIENGNDQVKSKFPTIPRNFSRHIEIGLYADNVKIDIEEVEKTPQCLQHDCITFRLKRTLIFDGITIPRIRRGRGVGVVTLALIDEESSPQDWESACLQEVIQIANSGKSFVKVKLAHAWRLTGDKDYTLVVVKPTPVAWVFPLAEREVVENAVLEVEKVVDVRRCAVCPESPEELEDKIMKPPTDYEQCVLKSKGVDVTFDEKEFFCAEYSSQHGFVKSLLFRG